MPSERDAAWDDDDELAELREAEGPLYRDPFDDGATCTHILALPEEVRERVMRSCPRCGVDAHAGSWIEVGGPAVAAGPCILQGIALDLSAYDEQELLEALRARLNEHGLNADGRER